jgi:hypothetical protein
METQEAVSTTAMVGVAPQSAASELAALQGIGGGSSTVMIIMGILAVVGGKAGWKFWADWRKQKHEEAMKKLELEAKVELAKLGEEVSPVEESPEEKPKKKKAKTSKE